MKTLKVKYDKTITDFEYDYYMINTDDLQQKVKESVPEVDHNDFCCSSSGFKKDGRKKIQIVLGVRKSFGSELIKLRIIPIL